MCRYSANKVLIFVFVEISINFVANYTTFFIALDKETWYSNHSCIRQAG